MVDEGVLIMVDRRIYDPRDAGDKLVLGMYSEFAEYENRARARWTAMARLAKARTLSARVPLPSGLVWVSPDDAAYPDYLERLREAAPPALYERVTDLMQHRTGIRKGEMRQYIMPYPDRDVITAVTLSVEWLLETGSIRRLVKRIGSGDPGWPATHRGEMPVIRGAGQYGPRCTVTWEKATRDRMYEFLQSPALYGIYVYEARSLRPYVGPRKHPNEKERR
jgi:hypothetical protein